MDMLPRSLRHLALVIALGAGLPAQADPITFHLAILSAQASPEEVSAALALAGESLAAPSDDNILAATLLRVVPEDDLAGQVAQQLAGGHLRSLGQREGIVQERRGVSADAVLQPRDPQQDPIGLELAAHAVRAQGDRLPTAVRYRESALTPQGRRILRQGQTDAPLRYGDALVIQLRAGHVLAVAPGMFDQAPTDSLDPAHQLSDEEFEAFLQDAADTPPVRQQGEGAAIEWYTPYGGDVPPNIDVLQ